MAQVSLHNVFKRYHGTVILDTAIRGAPTDSVYSHRAWLRTPRTENGTEGVRFPLLADKTARIAR